MDAVAPSYVSPMFSYIFDELNFVNNPYLMRGPEQTGSSYNDGRLKKQNKGLFLSDLFVDVNSSSIWRCSRKIFNKDTIEYSKLHLSNTSVLSTNFSSILYSYYENADHYKSHRDSSVVTVLFWFFQEPKRFYGGDLKFDDTGEVIKVENNTMIMFPSWANHSVSEVKMNDRFLNKKLGRYCISMFLNIVHPT